jgi:hypothetical protein
VSWRGGISRRTVPPRSGHLFVKSVYSSVRLSLQSAWGHRACFRGSTVAAAPSLLREFENAGLVDLLLLR